jgi:hypothetical protein
MLEKGGGGQGGRGDREKRTDTRSSRRELQPFNLLESHFLYVKCVRYYF